MCRTVMTAHLAGALLPRPSRVGVPDEILVEMFICIHHGSLYHIASRNSMGPVADYVGCNGHGLVNCSCIVDVLFVT